MGAVRSFPSNGWKKFDKWRILICWGLTISLCRSKLIFPPDCTGNSLDGREIAIGDATFVVLPSHSMLVRGLPHCRWFAAALEQLHPTTSSQPQKPSKVTSSEQVWRSFRSELRRAIMFNEYKANLGILHCRLFEKAGALPLKRSLVYFLCKYLVFVALPSHNVVFTQWSH